MYSVLIVSFWAIAAGIVTAGLFASLYQLLTNDPISFRLLFVGRMLTALIAVPLLALSGPIVIARHAMQGQLEHRSWGLLLASACIVGAWSFITGVVVIEFLLKLFS